MKELSRRSFMKGLAGVTGVAALGALGGMNVLAEESAVSYTPGTYSATAIGMGKVTVSAPVTLEAGGTAYTLTPVSTGNPHAVMFVEEADLSLPEQIGSAIEHHPFFPGGVNAEFVQVKSENRIRMRVWERGSGVTMACGTGTCASAAAAVNAGFCHPEEPVVVELDGGELEITVHKDGTVWMNGPAAFVFEAEVTMEGGE